MSSPHPARNPAPATRLRGGGFALLITVVLVAFLVLVLVGLASFTRVETQVAGNSQNQALARQNAIMALNIALGQLQRHTGPDQRVTAPADLNPLAVGDTTDPVSGFARDSRNRRWIGVWRDPDLDRTSLAPDIPAISNNQLPQSNDDPALIPPFRSALAKRYHGRGAGHASLT